MLISALLVSPGMLTVHFALVTVQERHGEDVVGYGSGNELTQHLREKTKKRLLKHKSVTDLIKSCFLLHKKFESR